jgi:hypothetical protein
MNMPGTTLSYNQEMTERKVLLWSNLFFLVPFFYSIYIVQPLSTLALAATMIASTMYHLYDEKRFARADEFCAWALIISNLWISYLGRFHLPHFFLALIFAGAAVYSLQRVKNGFGHSLWHFFSALVTIFSLLTYFAGSAGA